MSWVRGYSKDGYTVVDQNVDFRGTVLGAGDGFMRPKGSLNYFVDGTYGNDANSGKSWEGAFKTVQKAVTTQYADTNGRGDRIWIAPGTYSEAVVATKLIKCELIGVICGGTPKAVIINNVDGHALEIGADTDYNASMVNSAIRNITFYTPSSSNRELAAVRIDTIQQSVIDNCYFLGAYDEGAANIISVGLQLGNTSATHYSFHEFSTISNCRFGTKDAKAKEVDTAIRVGGESVTVPAGVGFSSMNFINNMIMAEHYGIRLGVGASNCGGSIIQRNSFHSHQGGGGVNVAIHTDATDGPDLLMQIVKNQINYHTQGINGFNTCNVHGNTVSITDANPVGLYPPAS